MFGVGTETFLSELRFYGVKFQKKRNFLIYIGSLKCIIWLFSYLGLFNPVGKVT